MKDNNDREILLEELHFVFKDLYANMAETTCLQQIDSFLERTSHFLINHSNQRIIYGWIAALCERAYYICAHGRSIHVRLKFKEKLKEVIDFFSKFNFLNYTGIIACGKRQPSFFEAFLPTFERFEVMERMPVIFDKTIDSIIVGGSMSYVPFFGIRHNRNGDFSDIDTLIVINDKFFSESSWEKFLNNDLFPLTEKRIFINRIKVFKELLDKNLVDVFSQRFSIIDKPFTISNHFITYSTFKRMVDTDLEKSLANKEDINYIMRDFRVDPFYHPCHARHTFDGERFESKINCHEVSGGGFIADMPGYIIHNGKFYPGVYQTIISPAFLVFYDNTSETRGLVNKFENIIYREVANVRKNFPSATYAKAHNRYDIFPPGRYDDGCNSYIAPKDIQTYLTPFCLSSTSFAQDDLADGSTFDTQTIKDMRKRARKSLLKWKVKILADVKIAVENFMDPNNHQMMMSLAKKQGLNWYIVATVPCAERMVKTLTLNDGVLHKELFTEIITPSDLMSLDAYEKLSRISRKVYVASVMDPVNTSINLPISYALVVPVV